jgi:hypothetical protein
MSLFNRVTPCAAWSAQPIATEPRARYWYDSRFSRDYRRGGWIAQVELALAVCVHRTDYSPLQPMLWLELGAWYAVICAQARTREYTE